MIWPRVQRTRGDGESAPPAPLILSVSRRSDIPAFYLEGFFAQLRRGYTYVRNPISYQEQLVDLRQVRFIVFWSKNPLPLLGYVDELRERGIEFYVHFTLNDYEQEGFELGLRPREQRLDDFLTLAHALGKQRMVWRFDPLILTESLGIDALLERVEVVGSALVGCTEKFVFSFVDIACYKKVQSAFVRRGVAYREWSRDEMREMAQGIARLNESWGYEISTCCEEIELSGYGIAHSKCVDDAHIVRLAHHDAELMAFLRAQIHEDDLFCERPQGAIALDARRYATIGRSRRDQGQRWHCGCAPSRDIGVYDTCRHQCVYCYACFQM